MKLLKYLALLVLTLAMSNPITAGSEAEGLFGGALTGAAIGGIAGGGRGAAIGAGVGGALGLMGGAAARRNKQRYDDDEIIYEGDDGDYEEDSYEGNLLTSDY
jgi:outer membrane lipoprotein SlyB